jgi:hypothetical protein
LREIEKQNPSRRIREGFEVTTSEQQQGTSARNNKSKRTEIPKSVYLKVGEKTLTTKSERLNLQIENPFAKMKDVVSKIEEVVCLINIEEQSLMIVQLKRDVELHELQSCKKISKFLTSTFYMEIIRNYRNSQKSKKEITSSDFIRNYLEEAEETGGKRLIKWT